MSEDILTTVEAAERLGISQRRIRTLLAEGRLEGKKIGGEKLSGKWAITRASIERYQRERRVWTRRPRPRKDG
jgi:excisionase family DNA binding protein